VTRGLRTGQARKSESIRITLSDLDLQQVASRATGHFQPCYPASRPVSRPVFTSKLLWDLEPIRVSCMLGWYAVLQSWRGCFRPWPWAYRCL
jgi:hypothetical protein